MKLGAIINIKSFIQMIYTLLYVLLRFYFLKAVVHRTFKVIELYLGTISFYIIY